ncbi:hypothetical protein GE061_017505 [Apolygus lucorum]|uniref:SAC3/GANP/THP3 conserved domain-containing protein n=1 Tax=Apolygus lucorum TaxID=248454 RepID=A0A8S9XDV5_APOLU|nr:hypothetical protein GE061_017505 [Apolygus lucorum]
MDRELEEELNWFAEDPVPAAQPPPQPLLKRSLGIRTKSGRVEGSKSKLRDVENEDSIGETKKYRRDGSPAETRHSRPDEGAFDNRKPKTEDLFSDRRKYRRDDSPAETKLSRQDDGAVEYRKPKTEDLFSDNRRKYKRDDSPAETKLSRQDDGAIDNRKPKTEDLFSDNRRKYKRDDSPAETKLSRQDDGAVEYRKTKTEDSLPDNRKSKSDEVLGVKQFDLLGKAAKTAVEKLSILEERDKMLRINLEKNKSSTGKQSTKGVCPDMCPEKERIMRDVRGIVAVHEAFPDTNIMDHSRAVKEYARSSADQDEPLPHELRPVPVLRMTMDYLISEIICRLDKNEGENKGNWYDFCWGRLRAIRKDIIQQQFCDINTVTIVEECARFHICCFDRLWGSPNSMFDDKINSETLMNCLQSLMYMYEDLRKQGKSCPNEAEFRAYMVLLKLHSGFVLSEFQQFPIELQKSAKVREAVDIHTAYSNNMYSTYFMLLKKTSYLNACLMQRFFGHLRTRALEIIVRSHCPPNKTINISVTYLAQTLKFDKANDCVAFCMDFGLLLNSDGTSFSVSRNEFYLPETMLTEGESSSLIVNKRIPVALGVLSNKDVPKVSRHEVHSSFTEDHFLKPGAVDASDQEEKMLRDNVSRTIIAKRKPSVEEGDVKETSSPEVHQEILLSPVTLLVDEGSIDIPEVDMSPDMPFDDEEEEIKEDTENFNELPIEEQDSPHSDVHSTQSSGHTSPSMVVTDESDSDSYNTTDLESISGAESVSPLKLVTTPPGFTPKTNLEQQKSPEKETPSAFSFSTGLVNFSKMSEPFKILSSQKSPETPPLEQKSFFKKPKTDSIRPSQKTKAENENNIIMAKLKKKLSEKMKHVNAKKYANIWRKKVEKIKEARENEGLSLRHITVEEYMELWGSALTKYRGKTLDRLSKRKNTNIMVRALLHLNIIDQLDSRVKAVGDRLADILGQASVNWADRYGNISQPQPVIWKLILSLPERIEDSSVFTSKLRLWCKTAFHSNVSAKSHVCFWKTKSGVPVFIHPIITEGIHEIDQSVRNFSAVILVRAKGWETTQFTEKRLKTLMATANTSVSLAVLTLGSEMEPLAIDKHDREKCATVLQTYWDNTDNFVSTLMSLAKTHHMDNLKVQSLGILIEIAIEKLLDFLHQDQYMNEELGDYLSDPNYIIKLHNILIDKLEEEISNCCYYSYYGLACELEPVVRKLKCNSDIFPANYQNLSAFKTALHSHMTGLKLDSLNWECTNSMDLLAELRRYCDSMGCSHLLSKLVRTINPPDSDSGEDLVSYLKDIPWLPIVEMLAKQRISKDAYPFKVVYREDKIKELTLSHWWLKL